MPPPGNIDDATSKPAPRLEAAALTASPAWFPLEPAGPDALRLVRLDEHAYRRASFLDQRVLHAHPPEALCSLASAAAAASRLKPQADYLFHIGHVGSTLVSRLIGERPELFSVREPALLRSMASHPAPASRGLGLEATLALLSRTWRPSQRAVIKTTSFVSELAEPLLRATERCAAVLMFTRPIVYLRAILGGPNSRRESSVLAEARLTRLRTRLAAGAPTLEPHSEGEWIAMAWLCEMTALCQAARRPAARILWVDFEAFLAAPLHGLDAILRTLGVVAERKEIAALLSGPLLRQYSKAPEYAYDAELRRRVLESADREHGAEIRRAMDWLARLAGSHPLIDDALAR